ncbi:hypothetical protein D3C85_192210 [compost metagenome]
MIAHHPNYSHIPSFWRFSHSVYALQTTVCRDMASSTHSLYNLFPCLRCCERGNSERQDGTTRDERKSAEWFHRSEFLWLFTRDGAHAGYFLMMVT